MRLELLERETNEFLVRTLYGILMILPQSEAFTTLHRRLTAIPLNFNPVPTTKTSQHPVGSLKYDIDFQRLLKHFNSVQEKHKEQKHKQKVTMLIERETNPVDL